MTTTNEMKVSAAEFNIEALDGILKDLRNARRAVLAIDSGRTETKALVSKAKIDLQAALDNADLEEITKHTDLLKRGMRKLAESTNDKYTAFNDAVDRLWAFSENNDDTLLEQPEEKEAA